MRFTAPTVLAALAAAAPALAQTPPRQPTGPTPEQVQAVQGLSPSEQARREALFGPGWQYRVAPPDPSDRIRDPSPEDLSNIDLRLRADEVSMTRLRDSELARENAVVFATEPALPYEFERRKVRLAQLRKVRPFRGPIRAIRRGVEWTADRF
jgi:hypothetical protein